MMNMDHNELAKQVLNLYPEIKFAGVVNVKGEIVAGGHKENVEQILEGDDVKMSIHYSIQKRELYTNLEHRIGKERSDITEFEKAAIIRVPINNNELFLVRTDKGIDYLKIVDFINSKLNPQKYIRDEIKVIQDEIEKLKNLKELAEKKSRKTKSKKRKPARKTAAKKKTVKRKTTKRKPARKTKSKRKTVKRR